VVRFRRLISVVGFAGALALSPLALDSAHAAVPRATCAPGQTTGCTAVGGTGGGAPTVSFEVVCGSGIDVNFSDLNGSVPVTFTVTTPGNQVDRVTVPAQKIIRRSYSVARGVRAPLTVSAPGMATRSARLPATCTGVTRVLGLHVTRAAGSAAGSAAAQLPFTGAPVWPSLALGLGLLLAGAGILRLAAPARR
jgi:hypothetical protein